MSDPICILRECDEPADFTLTLTPHYLPSRPIDDAYVARLREWPGATVDYRAGCHLRASIPVCTWHAGEAVDLWMGWLDGRFDRAEDVYDQASVAEEDLLAAGFRRTGPDEWQR
jgi:hypothetical protein